MTLPATKLGGSLLPRNRGGIFPPHPFGVRIINLLFGGPAKTGSFGEVSPIFAKQKLVELRRIELLTRRR